MTVSLISKSVPLIESSNVGCCNVSDYYQIQKFTSLSAFDTEDVSVLSF